MAHPVVNVTEEQAAAAIAGLDPGKVPYVLVCILRPSDEAITCTIRGAHNVMLRSCSLLRAPAWRLVLMRCMCTSTAR